ncbi:hypothetical protein PENSUB_7504 [Penicillium subrubescens]|uniref:Uncharacterized protein n=1 Tax=Penicillium subrubescens TaxID=1316194 RepID=A0A1Q5TL07_9EURO|nr:hypothetical protein PENSUB_7504 [Penicillium subrubescens]
MKAISLTSSSFLLSAAFFNNAFANIVTELGPNGLNASVKYTPDRDTLRKRAPAPGGNSDCAKWCAANFPNPGSDCTSLAAHGQGPCYTCGPKKSSPTQLLCGGQCRDTSSSSNNCGACGNKASDSS